MVLRRRSRHYAEWEDWEVADGSGEVMKLTDKEIQEAIRQGKKIKRRAWGRCEFVRHIKHAHIPSREPGKFKVEDVEIDDWEVV